MAVKLKYVSCEVRYGVRNSIGKEGKDPDGKHACTAGQKFKYFTY